jgi:hypothetical protein
LRGSTRIRELSLFYIGKLNIEVIDDLPNIEIFALSGQTLHAPQTIERLKKLKELRLSSTSITDLEVLTSLPLLATLSVSDQPVDSFAPIAKFPRLRRLDLRNYNGQWPNFSTLRSESLTDLTVTNRGLPLTIDLRDLKLPNLKELVTNGSVTVSNTEARPDLIVRRTPVVEIPQ